MDSSSETVSPMDQKDFYKNLKKDILQFVDRSGRPHKDEKTLVLKALTLFVTWALFYSGYLIWGGESLLLNISLSIPWALVMVSIQMSVMHDASHRSTSNNKSVNQILLNVISFLGGSPTLWVAQHCHAHHSFTNVPGKDHDIDTNGLLRLCSSQEFKNVHRYQHIYAWFLYPLFILSWVWWGDFRDIKNNTYGLSKKRLKSVFYETLLVKLWHIAFFIALPLWTIGDVGLVLTGYLVSFTLMGLIMVVVFQLAHVSMTQEFASEDKLKSSDWALFQLASTANFAPNNRFLSWYLGGLNHQIEHHIFPNLSHTHYPSIQNKVKQYCSDRGVTYHVFPTLREAIWQHQKHLIRFGAQADSI